MRSDASYERLVKLWISVWNLVLENKRGMEDVATLLQRIVFEARGYHVYKNWPEICKLGESNKMLMLAVAMIDIENDPSIKDVQAAFPQCFCVAPIHGPYPLSMLVARAQNEAAGSGYEEYASEQLETYKAIPKDVPIFEFDLYGRNTGEQNFPRLPKGIDPTAAFGTIVTWDNKSFVVVENHPEDDSGLKGLEEMTLVPAECIRIDL